jgi:hypothetical protein
VRYAVMHEGVPIGHVELSGGELVAGPLTPLPALEPLRATVQEGSAALLSLGFFGAATAAVEGDTEAALRAAAAIQLDLADLRGELVPTTFVNLLEAPDGGLVLLARFGHAHARVPAEREATPRNASDAIRPPEARA